jgi:hypothetical protein
MFTNCKESARSMNWTLLDIPVNMETFLAMTVKNLPTRDHGHITGLLQGANVEAAATDRRKTRMTSDLAPMRSTVEKGWQSTGASLIMIEDLRFRSVRGIDLAHPLRGNGGG